MFENGDNAKHNLWEKSNEVKHQQIVFYKYLRFIFSFLTINR